MTHKIIGGLLVAFATQTILISEASGQGCLIPDVIPIPEGSGSAYTLLLQYVYDSCLGLEVSQAWADLPVSDTSGALIGTTGEVLVADSYDSRFFLEIIGAKDRFVVALEPNVLSSRIKKQQFAMASFDEVAPYLNDDEILYGGKTIQVVPFSKLGDDSKLGVIVATGANPYPERIIVQFESEPPSAVVTVGYTRVGPTTTQAWVAKNALERIVLTLDGYEPCTFPKGSFSEPTLGSSAIFRCTFE